MAEFLELTQLGETHRVSQMDVRGGRVDAELHFKGATESQLGGQLLLAEDLGTASKKGGVLFGKGAHVSR
jgi:hypothetical protein